MASASTPAAMTTILLIAQLTAGPKYYLGLALLVVLLFVALIKAFRTWEEINDVEEPDSPGDLLESFQQAHAEGEIDDQELDRVRRLLADGDRKAEIPASRSRVSPPASPVVDAGEPGPYPGEKRTPDAS